MTQLNTAHDAPTGARTEAPRRFFRLRLGIIIFLASLFSILLAEMALMIPSLYVHEERLLEAMHEETIRQVKVATLRNTLDDQSEKDIIDVLEKLSKFSLIRGGQLYDTLGDPVGGFGTEASLSHNSVASDGVKSLRSPDGRFYDIFIPQVQSGLSYDLILRLDTSHIAGEITAYMVRIAKSALIISGITIVSIFLVLYLAVVRPIQKIKKAVMAAIDEPDLAGEHQLGFRRGDEIGEIGNAIDKLLLDISIIYQNELSAAQDAIVQSMSAIIQYDPDGKLIAANSAALNFFCAASLEDLRERDQEILLLPSRHESRRFTVTNSLENRLEDANGGSYIEDGFVLVNGLEIPVLVMARPVRNRYGEVQRYFANLVDISKIALQKDHLSMEIDKLGLENGQLGRRNEELKKLMESCLILLEDSTKRTADKDREPVMPDRIIIHWYRDAQKSGLTHSAQLEHGILPAVMGHPERQKALFRQALTLVYLRSNYVTPQLTIAAVPRSNGMLNFIVFDTSSEAGLRLKPENAPQTPDWKICYAALSQLITREGGKLLGFAEDRYENAIAFDLVTKPAEQQSGLHAA